MRQSPARSGNSGLSRLKPVEILGGVNRDQFLGVLNRSRDLPGSVSKLREGGRLGDHIRLRNADVSHDHQLRLYVDEWLQTGLTEGLENPSSRDLLKAPNACAAVRRFGEKAVQLAPSGKGLQLRFPIVQGGHSIRPPEAAIDAPDRLFSLFMLCDWRMRLAKCRRAGCGRYFELKHWNREYKRGTVCPQCQRLRSLESAISSTSKARKAGEAELYRMAARHFKKKLLTTTEWYRDQRFKARIVSFLNEQIKRSDTLKRAYPREITCKWLSWSKNRNAIEKAARGAGYAEG